MNTKTDASRAGDDGSTSPLPAKKPRFAIFIATAAGLGYFPKAPGTFGSLAGLALAVAVVPVWLGLSLFTDLHLLGLWRNIDVILVVQIALTLFLAGVGVWSANRASEFWHIKDPQRVVIDEVSGQHLTLLLGCVVPIWWRVPEQWGQTIYTPLGAISWSSPFNWNYLLVGFLLFRLFDIWKPFPARQAEALPGGWGIMTDDWVAGIYAGIGLWLARAAGL
jgi:phosphatidylglycerophosphatase A